VADRGSDLGIDALLGLLVDEPEDELSQLLVELRWLVLKHPIAIRAACRALRAEGVRFAATDEGEAWRRRLAGSELIRRGELICDVGLLGALDADECSIVPGELIDAFARASARRDLETAVARRTEVRIEEDT